MTVVKSTVLLLRVYLFCQEISLLKFVPPNTSSQIALRFFDSPSSIEMKMAPSGESRSRARSSLGYIMLHQSEWKRPLDSGLATRRPPSSSNSPLEAAYSACVSAKSSS